MKRPSIGQGPGHVGGVEVAALGAHVEEHQLARREGAGVVDPVQRRRVPAAADDGVVADVVAHRPGAPEEGALHPALAVAERVAPVAHDVLEPERGDVAGLLQLTDLPVVLDQPGLGDDPGEVLVEGLVRGDEAVDGVGDTAEHPGLAGDGERVLEEVDVADLEPQRVRDLPQGRATTDPELAVHAVPEELVAVAARARPGVEHGLAVLDDQDGVAGLVAAVVGVRGVGPEAVLGVVGTHLERARGQDQALAGEHRGERGAPAGRGVGDRVPGEVEVGAAPALPHELRVRVRHGRVVRLRVQVLGQRLPALRGRGVECRLVAGVAAHPARVRRSGVPGPAPVTLLRMDGATATDR